MAEIWYKYIVEKFTSCKFLQIVSCFVLAIRQNTEEEGDEVVRIPLSQQPCRGKIICGIKHSSGLEKGIQIQGKEYRGSKLSIVMDPTLLEDRFELIVAEEGRLILQQSQRGNIWFNVSSDITLQGTDVAPETDFIEVNWQRRKNKSVLRYTFYVPFTTTQNI